MISFAGFVSSVCSFPVDCYRRNRQPRVQRDQIPPPYNSSTFDLENIKALIKSLPRSQLKSSPGYLEATRRIAKTKASPGCLTQKQLKEKIDSLPQVNPQFLRGVKTGDFNLIHSVKDYPIHALRALEEGLLSQEDFASVMMPWSSSTCLPKSIKLFKVDKYGKLYPNPIAKRLIIQTLQSEKGTLLSKEEIDEFFEVMKTKSPLQQQFFLELPKSSEERKHIRNRVEEAYRGLNVFSNCRKDGKDLVMIPSPSMMQSFLDVKFKENAVKMNFVLGLSKVADIKENGLTQTRDVGLRFPDVFSSQEADGFLAEETDFTYHDFFHSIVASCGPSEDQKRFIAIADAINKVPTQEKKVQKQWHDLFVDMELGQYYLATFKGNSSDLFLTQLYSTINSLRTNSLAYTPFTEEATTQAIAKEIGLAVFNTSKEKQDLANFIGRLNADLEQQSDKIKLEEAEIRKLRAASNDSFEDQIPIVVAEATLSYSRLELQRQQEMRDLFQIMLDLKCPETPVPTESELALMGSFS